VRPAPRPAAAATHTSVTHPTPSRTTWSRTGTKAHTSGRTHGGAPATPATKRLADATGVKLPAGADLPTPKVDTQRPRGVLRRTVASVVSGGQRTADRPVKTVTGNAGAAVTDAGASVQRLLPGG
jgi:hypothetical protein